jgi:hypothetical protein
MAEASLFSNYSDLLTWRRWLCFAKPRPHRSGGFVSPSRPVASISLAFRGAAVGRQRRGLFARWLACQGALPQARPSADGRIDTGGISRETRIERVEKATGQGVRLPGCPLKFAIANVVRQSMLSTPQLTEAQRGKTGLNPSREILKCRDRGNQRRNRKDCDGVPTCGDVLDGILGHLALLPIWREGFGPCRRLIWSQ